MCVQFLKIKAKNKYAPQAYFVPCGKCEECRRSLNSQWFFRLRSELDWCSKNGWNIGFFTLTYDDVHVPRFPEEIVKNQFIYKAKGEPPPMCFRRKDVRDFIDNIRKRLHERYRIAGIRYMVCSEYGSDPNYTQRPHYHGLICFPSKFEKVDYDTGEVTQESLDPREVFQLIKQNWTDHGFVFPRVFEGGRDSHGHEHKPFLLQGDISRAARYASKYTCKDIGFTDLEGRYMVDRTHKDYKLCKPFHIQSKSIGLRWLENRSDAELLKLLQTGESFVGDKFTRQIPLYIKHKIFYTPKYTFEPSNNGDWWYDFGDDKWRFKAGQGTHRRLVGKEATRFFKNNVNQIFAQKVEYYEKLFSDMCSPSYWTARRIDDKLSVQIQKAITSYGAGRLAVGFLSYFGVPYDKCVWTKRPELFFCARYVTNVNMGHKTLVSRNFYDTLHRLVGLVVEGLKFAQKYDLERQAKAKRVGDFHKHLT